MISHLDKNTNMYSELVYVYKKYNIILRPDRIATNKIELYEKMLDKIEYYSNYNFDIINIKNKYDSNEKIKMNLISLNKEIKDMQEGFKALISDNNIIMIV